MRIWETSVGEKHMSQIGLYRLEKLYLLYVVQFDIRIQYICVRDAF